VIGSSDPERVGLAKRRMIRLLAPQVQENPIYFHMTDSSSEAFRRTVDQESILHNSILAEKLSDNFYPLILHKVPPKNYIYKKI
jgi:hypothetical protein